MFSKLALIAIISLVLVVEAAPSLLLKTEGPNAVNTVDDLHVVTTLTNTGNETLKLLNHPHTVLSGLPSNNFAVSHKSRARPSFKGALVKYRARASDNENAYTVLAPGQTINFEHNFGQTYNFTNSCEGEYNISPRNIFYVLNADLPSPPSKRRLPPTQQRCLQAVIQNAIPPATAFVVGAATYLQALLLPSPRYTTWFGAWDTTRKALVTNHFLQIQTNHFERFSYDCTCTKPDTWASVYPDNFGKFYFCSEFLIPPVVGTDSQAGTIVHEASYFNFNGATDDIEYVPTYWQFSTS
ncbi:zincin [Agrocybe pediades]|nr:zincin [Agrocybe pediades]